MKHIEWKYLVGLHKLYTDGKTKLKILNNDYINLILFKQKKLIRFKSGNHSIIEANQRYTEFYKLELLDTHNYYNTFFEQSGIENNAKKTFTQEDLEALMFVYYNKKELQEKLTTVKKFSARVFRNENSKYLENKPSLKTAVLQLLEVNEFPEKDPKNQQWRFVIDCDNPKAIVLCENLDCLKIPVEYKKNNIELWYVGGNNTKPLQDIQQDKLQLPIYYFCDWDYAGLNIYSKVKEIFHNKNKEIQIIQPPANAKRLPVGVKHHKSKWKKEDFSGLTEGNFSQEQVDFINQLISDNEWVEEESMDLINLLDADLS
ncbi:hypothetical protein [Pedobacter frigoris]|uniref:Wadjet protein JetD C-terminal domain-containing protein n=1 Tax=Pedobacter frigoris TaxID=2571272 RepID=A0A4U1CN61_9SPHI|nr:hypothetical protein [Pedobacter frigoris]TKC08924.1 hypothetical protein FA047_02175 [Pedobacter frigoris]